MKFTLALNGAATCQLPPATIAVIRTAGGPLGVLSPASFSLPSDDGANFRITDCQYIYNLDGKSLGSFFRQVRHVAAKYPMYFSTLTGYPGLLDGPDRNKAAAIKSMCIFMHVGALDDGWKGAMQSEAAELKNQGYKIQFSIEPKQVHRLKASEINLSARLFAEIESCK